MKPVIKLQFKNGLLLPTFKKEVFDINGVSDLYDFVESNEPDFIIFGPYGNDIPPSGNYTRIGYFCENVMPDMQVCEWAFGIPNEADVNHPRYKRIQWHGTDPQALIKTDTYNAEQIAADKKHFCNFLYSHRVLYREAFFKQLSARKRVDAPGRSMKNMPGIDEQYTGNIFERKRKFLTNYKFTVAFENYVYPGYQTEKLYDAMLSNSIPIYFGDPLVGNIFNTASFVNAADYIIPKNKKLLSLLEKVSQPSFVDIRPAFYKSPLNRLQRKLKAWGRAIKMDMQFKSINFTPLINRIIELDSNPVLYAEMLKQPWFIDNRPPQDTLSKNRWIEIFESKF
ncbi:glycosyltransferase family 10 domain-containing protein [Mucilaginibacter phyllosphaerae]